MVARLGVLQVVGGCTRLRRLFGLLRGAFRGYRSLCWLHVHLSDMIWLLLSLPSHMLGFGSRQAEMPCVCGTAWL